MKEQLYVESLTVKETNREAIQKFSATKKGKGLEKYLKNLAWKEDMSMLYTIAEKIFRIIATVEDDDTVLINIERFQIF